MSVATSKNLRASTELLLVADIKPGLVKLPDPTTYATRLGLLFEALFGLRKRSVELGGAGFVGPLEGLHTLHFVRFSIFDQSRRLLLAVTFDKPWEPYIRSIVDDAGPILDVILSHCVGFESSTSADGFPAFARWVHEHQIETHFLHAGFPELSIDDIHYLTNLKRLLEERAAPAAADPASLASLALAARVSHERGGEPDWDTFDRVLVALYRLRLRFPGDAFCGRLSEREIYDRAAGLILNGFGPTNLHAALEKRSEDLGHANQLLPTAILAAYNGIERWLESLLAQPVTAKRAASDPPPSPDGVAPHARPHAREGLDAAEEKAIRPRVQGLVLPGYGPLSHGCLVLVRFGQEHEVERTVGFLRYLAANVTRGDQAESAPVKLNVGFTAAGLKKLGLDDVIAAKLPVELRQGMEARAGLLGDVGTNHPEHWRRPKQNWLEEGQPKPKNGGDELDLSSVDAVVLLQTEAEGMPDDHDFVERHPLRNAVVALEAAGARILHVKALRRYRERRTADGKFREHFGYLDGFSSPSVVGTPAQPGEYNNTIALGELLIGHLDDHRDEEDFGGDQALRELLLDGSYFAIRDLAQDVGAFHQFVDTEAGRLKAERKVLYAKVVGRDREGRPTTTAKVSGPNEFDYHEHGDHPADAGAGCPLQSHTRLSNPRLAVTASVNGRPQRMPRIVRRGFSYGRPYEKAAGDERGLLFMACNAKIGEQYEVIQRWLNGGNSTGLHSSQRDLLTAPHERGLGPRFTFELGGRAHMLPPPPTPFVTLRWGLYVLLPSIACLQALPDRTRDAIRRKTDSMPRGLSASTMPPPNGGGQLAPDAQQILRAGMALLARLQSVDRSYALEEWKKVLEDVGRRAEAFALWAAIRAQGGVLRTPYGVLVGDPDVALEVLRDERRFSVREYWRRMRHSSMLMYLGMDRAPVARAVCPVHAGTERRKDEDYVQAIGKPDVDYDRVLVANAYIHDISRVHAFTVAFDAMQRAIHQAHHDARTKRVARTRLDLLLLGEKAVSDVSQRFFGLPDGRHMHEHGQPVTDDEQGAYCPYDFTVASQYVFRPNPDSWTEELSRLRGRAVHRAATTFVKETAHHPHEFVALLWEGLREDLERRRRPQIAGDELQAELEGEVVRSLVGAVDGFVAANWGSFLSATRVWMERDELARVQREVQPLGELRDGLSAGLSELAFDGPGDDGAKGAAMRAARHRAGAEQLRDAFDPESEPPPEEAPEVDRALWALGKLAYEVGDDQDFVKVVTDTLKIAPVPAWLHRTALVKTTLGSVAIEPGDAITIHLGSAALEQPGPSLLFGGPYRGDGDAQAPLHACPGRDLALGTLLGMLAALLREQDLRREGTWLLSCSVPLADARGISRPNSRATPSPRAG